MINAVIFQPSNRGPSGNSSFQQAINMGCEQTRGNSRLEETTFKRISTLLQVNKPYVFLLSLETQMPEMLR